MIGEETLRVFSTWDCWGRGWYSSEAPVTPEPPLFEINLGGTGLLPIDDGIRESVLDRVVRFVLGESESKQIAQSRPGVGDLVFSPHPVGDQDLVGLSIDFGNESREVSSLGLAGAFLETLRCIDSPISFEIARCNGRTEIQIVVNRSDCEFICSELLAYFPGIELRRFGISDWNRFENGNSHSLVVEFGLSSSFFLPLRLKEDFVTDPFTGIVGALEQVQDSETGIIQLIFEPLGSRWKQSIRNVFESGIFDGVPDESARLIRRKCRGPLFGVVCRLGVVSDRPGREWNLASSIAATLVAFDNRGGNELFPISNEVEGEEYDRDSHLEDLFMRRSRRHGMILSAEELVGMVHMPSPQVVKLIQGKVEDEKRVPELADGEVTLGQNLYRGESHDVVLPRAFRSRHMHVIGASGSGKSNFLLHIIRQEIAIGTSVIVIDPHGDLIDGIFGHITARREDNVVLFDIADEEFPVGLNLLGAKSDRERMQLESDVVAVFRRFSTSWGDQMTTVLSNAIQLVLEARIAGTIFDVRRVLIDGAFRRKLLATVDDPECKRFWMHDFAQVKGAPVTSIVTRLNAFFRPRAIRHVLAQRGSRFDLEGLVNSGKTVLFRIPQGIIGEENTFILGSLILAKLNLIALGRASLPPSKRHPTVCYIDEFQNMLTPSLRSMLEGARKYDWGLVLAHQQLGQLNYRGESVSSSLLTNTATRLVFKVNDSDARVLEREFQSFTAETLVRLRIGNCICRIGSADQDFNLTVPFVPPPDRAEACSQLQRIRSTTRDLYSRSRAEVADELAGASEDVSQDSDARSSDELRARDRVSSEGDKKEDGQGQSRGPGACEKIVSALAMEGDAPPGSHTDTLEPEESSGGRTTPTNPALPGRGGKRHKELQHRLCEAGHGRGFTASVEHKLQKGGGSVDVVLRRATVTIACEIGVTTSIEHEIENVCKCIAEDFTYVIAISEVQSRLKKIRAGVRESASPEDFERTRYLSVADAEHFIASVAATESPVERVVRGYKVTRSVVGVSSQEQREKEGIIEKTLADALEEKRAARRKKG